jgi:anhydro-N-acetylmuramic acid kinase
MPLFIGLMSGTSLDGVDGVLAELPQPVSGAHDAIRVRAHVHLPMPAALAAQLLALNRSGPDELHRAALASHGIVDLYDTAVGQLLAGSGVERAQVVAVGAHGQTVRHRPREFDATGYTVQLLDGALLAERCGIDIVCDFRSRDLAAGGEGAPLVPAFHAARFAEPGRAVAVLNVGGIANLTLLGADAAVSGFDCGPGNLLMDLWCRRQTGRPYDAGGAWAAGGRVDAALLAGWLADPFFARMPPKSTGRDLFDEDWLLRAAAAAPTPAPQDVMATLAELSARAAAEALRRHAPATGRLMVCGGGAHNQHLMRRLAALLPGVAVESTAAAGVPPDQVEALAFAWLAQRFVQRLPGSLPSVTGAREARVLGALNPAGLRSGA